MPLKMCGSVSARFSVWFSAISRAANAARSASSTSSPPGSCSPSAASPAPGGWRPAASSPASVSSSVPLGEVEGEQPDLAGNRRAPLAPPQPAGDHQVDDEEQVPSNAKTSRLPSRRMLPHRAARDGGDRRVVGADDERIADPHRLDRLAGDACRQCAPVQLDVGQFGHRGMLGRQLPTSNSQLPRRSFLA